VRLIRVPTTVLAQDDSGVGVKSGVNLHGVKNFVGAFAPPFAVLNDLDLLHLLSPRDKVAGMAEAVKVALIRDGAFFAWLERHADDLLTFERAALARMIRRCAELHMRQIAHGGDPFETGSARPLDFGHWSAHKLESLTRHHLRHGEAVAIGIALDARYSVLTRLLRKGEEERICALLEHLGFRLWHPALDGRRADGRLEVLDGLREFREHLGGDLTVTLLEDIGRGVEVHEIDEATMLDAIAWLRERDQRP
jgi:3-dehydroquinate synthase